nr:calcium-binding protein [uncultured Gellertiella sp.]
MSIYLGSNGNDTIAGFYGDDQIFGRDGNDALYGGYGQDQLYGGAGTDRLYGGNGDDTLYGGDDNDTLFGDAGNDVLDGGAGADILRGGGGDDTYFVDNSGDSVDEAAPGSDGTDTVFASVSFTLGLGLENLILTGTDAIDATGNGDNNGLVGNDAANHLDGGDGRDVLYGGFGNDILTGGSGPDSFAFTGKLDGVNNVDHITDFVIAQDVIPLDHQFFTALAPGVISNSAFESNTTGIATRASDRLVYDTSTGKLYYDHDGAGGDPAILFAVMDNHVKLTAADFVVF